MRLTTMLQNVAFIGPTLFNMLQHDPPMLHATCCIRLATALGKLTILTEFINLNLDGKEIQLKKQEVKYSTTVLLLFAPIYSLIQVTLQYLKTSLFGFSCSDVVTTAL